MKKDLSNDLNLEICFFFPSVIEVGREELLVMHGSTQCVEEIQME